MIDSAERNLDDAEAVKSFLNHIGFFHRLTSEDDDYVRIVIEKSYRKETGVNSSCPINVLFEFCIKKLVEAEKELSKVGLRTTLDDESLRDQKFRHDSDRWSLKEQIINDCYSLIREDDETKIGLGKGGMLPNGGNISFDKKAVICVGGPASGKSGFCQSIADELKAFTLDCDIIAKKIPEFDSSCVGASLVHDEAKDILTGIIKEIKKGGPNLVIPTIGKGYKSMLDLIDRLRDCGYQVSVVLIRLNKCETACRAFTRFLQTGRYVPIPYVLDTCGNESVATFYRLAAERRDESFLCIDNNCDKNHKPTIEFKQNSDDIKNILIKSNKCI